MADSEIQAARGKDGTLRRYRVLGVVEQREYIETLCSWPPCSQWFEPVASGKDRFCSPQCRLKAHRAGKASNHASGEKKPATAHSRASR